ncbi:hypothetical protein CJD36_022405 [Flavipsychrobacter stenotrophus]|uniref:histidine kinase n=1 Tax=Flavipsychrobacter stenotrophus TaxID=2077091 RepID=A0A2S7SQ11_9BACT|nr:HAMP domain-containing sensor histidine kinase [Flavipsychrobacter stenotrophus]PQJ08808.1 hypothetical protein CJD36_022405 [Flavipsychrobacter stenotrophus]
MKLFAKYNRVNLTVTIIIFLVGSCVFYFLMQYIFIQQIDEALGNEKEEIITYARKYGKLPEIVNTEDQYIDYLNIPGPATPTFKNTYVQYARAKEWSRQVQFGMAVSNNTFTIVVSKPLEENESLLQVVVAITIGMIALILLAGYLINRAVLTRLWQPFYNTISFIRGYDIEEKAHPAFPKTDIDEFDLLNENIQEMTSRVQADFQSLKEFTGNAAHEMQTPLSVIRTRLELILQNEALLQKNADQVNDIENAVRKLSKLYQSLLLLTKIEHSQFPMADLVKIDEVMQEKLDEILDIISSKGLHLEFIQYQPVTVRFHAYLAEIVVGNLLNNAVRYNTTDGWIGISLKSGQLSISNTSELEEIKEENLFKRFFRDGNTTEDGNGLGLAIVKRICDAAGYRLEYSFKDGRHTFTLLF